MTASDDSERNDNNSTDQEDSHQPNYERIRDHLRDSHSWTTPLQLAFSAGVSQHKARQMVERLGKEDGLRRIELGDTTLILGEGCDPRHAVARLSDRREQTWRALTDDEMPDLDDRRV